MYDRKKFNYLVNAGLLIIVNPLDPVVRSDCLHRFRQQFRVRHDKVVENRNDVARRAQRARNLLVDPVALLVIVEAAV